MVILGTAFDTSSRETKHMPCSAWVPGSGMARFLSIHRAPDPNTHTKS
jgi:hypothetical protein